MAGERSWRWDSRAVFSPGTLTERGWVAGIGLALAALIVIPAALGLQATPSPVGELVRDAQNVLTPETEFALVDFQEPNAIWEMRRVAKGYAKVIPASDVPSFLSQAGPHAVIEITDNNELLLADTQLYPDNIHWKTFDANGFNAAKGDFLGLTLIVKP